MSFIRFYFTESSLVNSIIAFVHNAVFSFISHTSSLQSEAVSAVTSPLHATVAIDIITDKNVIRILLIFFPAVYFIQLYTDLLVAGNDHNGMYHNP